MAQLNPIIKITTCEVFLTPTAEQRRYSKLSATSAIDISGDEWAWGENFYGSLGNNSTTCYSTPVAVCGAHTFCEMSNSNYMISLAIDHQGKAWAWGENFYGSLGNNSTTCYSTPVAVCGAHTFCKIESYAGTSFAIDKNGKAWGWGNNSTSSIGDNTGVNKSMPVAVCGAHTFCHISAGLAITV